MKLLKIILLDAIYKKANKIATKLGSTVYQVLLS